MPEQTLPTPVVVFDIDGTLADCDHRRHYVEGKRKNFDAFYEAMAGDPPVEHMRGLHNMYYLNNWTLIYCTGRPEIYRDTTRQWLDDKGFLGGGGNILMMRRNEDRYDPDFEVKQRMFDNIVGPMGYRIHMVFDDRQQVVDMWRRNGVPCLQVAEGNF